MASPVATIASYRREVAGDAQRCPIARNIQRDHARLRCAFQSAEPFPRFAVIPGFLRRTVAENLRLGCEQGHYSTFCAYTLPGVDNDLRNAFCEPNENDVYVTIHKRLIEPVPAIDRFARLFEKRETIDALSLITGLRLTRAVEPGVVTYWPPSSFLEAHTDYAEESDAKLVLSISLTANWNPSYGGATAYAFSGANRSVRLQPSLNSAVLFTPFCGSWHWVEQIAESAPPLRRFTWTAFFE
jgi:hypothetical protein